MTVATTVRTWSAFVPGVPAPKGSGQQFVSNSTGKLIYKPDSPRLKAWTAAIRQVATFRRPRPDPFSGPVVVRFRFYLPRPISNTAVWPIDRAKGDLDKLCRGAADPLCGPVLADDSLIVRLIGEKAFADDRDSGCEITVWEAE